jgi:outer membrane protein assembly factor BamD
MSEIRRAARLIAIAIILAGVGACRKQPPLPPTGAVDADKFLYTRGTEELQQKHWVQAREYFRRLIDTYPQSPFRHDAKLGVGDTYLGEDRVDTNILAANEFREFLTFFPLHERADYAQYQLAVAQMRQMLKPGRDQTATIDALKEFDTFLTTYPNSSRRAEAEKLRREVRDRLSASEFRVGLTYYRQRWFVGAAGRFEPLLKDDPQFSMREDALFYLGDSYLKMGRSPEARVRFEQLLEQFPEGKRAEQARKLLAEIKGLEG